MQNQLADLFEREIDRLIADLNNYTSEENIWRVAEGTSNCAGNLALHLAGNLRFYVGSVLGGTGYVRQRDNEFSDKDIPRNELIALLNTARQEAAGALRAVSAATLAAPFPDCPLGDGTKTDVFLLHLLWHFSYHQGQVNYHRRILENR